MNILITGGTGFISSHIVAALLSCGHQVTTLSRSGEFAVPLGDLEHSKGLRILKGEITDRDILSREIPKADALIHNASAVGAQGAQRLNGAYVETNVGGANCIAHVLSNVPHSLKHVIVGSSISVYGEGNYTCSSCGIVRPPVRRTGNWQVENGWNPSCPSCQGQILPGLTKETAARNGEHLYAITKKYQEDLLTLVANNAEIPLTIFRYATVYGPGQRRQNPYMQMMTRLSSSVAPIVFEDGLQSRDFIEVSDVVRVNLKMLDSQCNSVRVFNIGSGAPRAMIDFVRELCSTYSKKTGTAMIEPVIKETLAHGDVRHCSIDCQSALDKLGFQVEVSMDEGIERFIDWFVDTSSVGVHDALNARL